MANYYIVENNQQSGPFTPEQLSAKEITPETYVWTEGMDDWTQAGQVSELQQLLVWQVPEPQEPSCQPPSETPGSSTTSSEKYVPMPKDYKVHSILLIAVSVLCCGVCCGIINLVFGVLALLEADKVEGFYRMGNYLQAKACSDKAGKYFKTGVVIAIAVFVLNIILLLVYGGIVYVGVLDN